MEHRDEEAARRLYDGNLSAVVAEGLRRVREEEGREALLEWLGEAARATPSELQAVRDEWRTRSRGALRGLTFDRGALGLERQHLRIARVYRAAASDGLPVTVSATVIGSRPFPAVTVVAK